VDGNNGTPWDGAGGPSAPGVAAGRGGRLVAAVRERRGDLPLFGLSMAAGMSSYVFSLLVDRAFGAAVLAHVLRLVSASSAVTLPSALVLLPVAAWATHTAHIRPRLPWLQVVALVLGAASFAAMALPALHVPPAWLPGLGLLAAGSSYLLYLGSGVLCGRGAFIGYGVVTAMPTVGRVLVLAGVLAAHGTVVEAMWGVGLAAFAASALATILSYRMPEGSGDRPVAGATWASAFVALSVTAWLSCDIFFGSVGVGPASASLFAVIALLGKTPYWLAQPLATKAIAEQGLGRGGGASMSWEIFAIGGAGIVGGAVLGPTVLHLMQVPRSGLLSLLLYFAGSTLLCRAYVSAGSAAQRGQHQWWPLLAAFALYVVLAFVQPTTVLGLSARFCLGITAAAGVQAWLERRVARALPSPRRAEAVTAPMS